LARAGLPVYVGKANGYGGLYRRLADHRDSIVQAENLNIEDFEVRFIVLSDDDAYLACMFESAFIKRYNPLWNKDLPGFGLHHVGDKRTNGKISKWDTVHPGRQNRGVTPNKATSSGLEALLREKERAICKKYGIPEREMDEAESSAAKALSDTLTIF
jgi:hypothetical protein